MCGIAGYFSYASAPKPVDSAVLSAIGEQMKQRGPDGSGTWVTADRSVGLVHRRLAIIDLSDAGAQPMSTADGRLTIVFNGEIYNYRELRDQLIKRGYQFRTRSDTEVLLMLYLEHGTDLVQYLRGMFAFAIWDDAAHTLFLARDPFGIKPLYYSDNGESIYFASQVKALLQAPEIARDLDPAGHVGFYAWGNVPEPYTMFRAIRALPAGSTLTLSRRSTAKVTRYFNLSDEFRLAEAGPRRFDREAVAELLLRCLTDSVSHHLIADVPVGVFLSAGIDSSAIAALAARTVPSGSLRAVTLQFREYENTENDESPLASDIARRLHAQHRCVEVGKDDFDELMPAFFAAMDQPSLDGLNSYLVSRATAQTGLKVALSGLGGDELFAGYPSFSQIPRLVRYSSRAFQVPGIRRLVGVLLAVKSPLRSSEKFLGLAQYADTYAGAYFLKRGLYLPWEIERHMDRDFFRSGWETLNLLENLRKDIDGIASDYARVSVMEITRYMQNQLLRDSDWASMAHSLELRVPLVDVALWRGLLPLLISPDRPPKSRLPGLMEELPQAVGERAKTGFATPVYTWASSSDTPGAPMRGPRAWAGQVLGRYLEHLAHAA